MCREIVLRKILIQVSKIDTDSNSALFFGYRDNIRYPFHQGYEINKPRFEKFLNFSFNSCGLPRMDLPYFFPGRFSCGIGFNLMEHNGWVNPQHLFIRPGENIMELFKNCLIGFRFICRVVLPNMNVLNSIRIG